ncbi:alpha/beta hydrolase [Tsukamurella sp. NPDC003166]|uniref:alpha/beta fold hydrolase n=1 Tax=Tsukamurella sp. NPDC003166 TaxID=3154444 RepID=UPI0033A924E6
MEIRVEDQDEDGAPIELAEPETLSDRLLEMAGATVLSLYRRPALATAISTGVGWGIRYEQLWRRALGGRRRRPHINWHEGGRGPALVLINGFTGSGIGWPTVWVSELEKHFRVIRVDNRGTGWSRRAPMPFTISDMADDIADVLTACGLETATVFGQSMGGMIAQEFAMRHPHRVDRLVLCATIPPVPAFTANPHGVSLAAGIAFPSGRDIRRPTKQQLTDFLDALHKFTAAGYEPPDNRLEEFAAQNLVRGTSRYGAFCQGRAINAWRDPSRLRHIYTPTVIVQGAADRVVVPANGHSLAELIPGAEYVEVPGVGHLIPWEATQVLTDLLMKDREHPTTSNPHQPKENDHG